MNDFNIELIEDPSYALQEDLWKLLNSASVARMKPSDPQETHSFALTIRRDNELRAGLLALSYFGGMNLQCLWVHEDARSNGLGARLLQKIEGIARDLKCNVIWGHTFGFQAKEFYIKNGYIEFGSLPEYPPGYGCSFLKKNL